MASWENCIDIPKWHESSQYRVKPRGFYFRPFLWKSSSDEYYVGMLNEKSESDIETKMINQEKSVEFVKCLEPLKYYNPWLNKTNF